MPGGILLRWSLCNGREKNGVYTKLKSMFPGLIGWHCLNHRLELSVSDAVKHCTETNHFTAFLDKLYCLYNQSPKNPRVRELCDLLKIGFSGVKQSYRDYKENARVSMHESLLKLKHAVETIAVSSAECERGFSEMNTVVTPLRSQLKI